MMLFIQLRTANIGSLQTTNKGVYTEKKLHPHMQNYNHEMSN